MTRWIVLAVLVVVLATAATVAVQFMPVTLSAASGANSKFPVPAAPEVKGPKPKVVIEGEKTFEFGTLPQRTTGKHGWVVKNGGEGNLELWMISSTCSCTLAKFKDGKRTTVKPGESTEIVLEYETRENNGDYQKGAQIGTNDPDLPEFPLYVHGAVYPAIITVPSGTTVNFMTVPNEVDDHMQYIGLFSKDRPDLKILKVATSNDKAIQLTPEPMTEEECKNLKIEKGYRLPIHVKSILPLGVFKEEIVLTTDHPQEPELRLTVIGKMSGPVNLIPPQLSMHQAKGQSGDKGEVIVAVRQGRETQIRVEKAPAPLQCTVTAERKGRYKLTVTIPPGTPAQEIEGEIVLKTDHPKAETVHVPVDIWVQSAR